MLKATKLASYHLEKTLKNAKIRTTIYVLLALFLCTQVSGLILAVEVKPKPVATAPVNHYLFGMGATEGVFLYDVKDPKNPKMLKNFSLDNPIKQLCWEGDYLYVLQANNGVKIYFVQNPENPMLLYQFTNYVNKGYDFSAMYADRTRLVLYDRKKGVFFFDITNKQKPVNVGRFLVDAETPDFFYRDLKGYFCDEKKFYAVDFTNLQKMNKFYQWQKPGVVKSPTAASGAVSPADVQFTLLANNKKIYVSGPEVAVFDFTNPHNVKRSEIELEYIEDTYRDSLVIGNYLYYFTTTELVIYNITNPAQAKLHHEMNLPFGDVYDVVLQGNYLYIANGRFGLGILDITNPGAPKILTSEGKNCGNAERVFLSRDKLTVDVNADRFLMLDVQSQRKIGECFADTYTSNAVEGGKYRGRFTVMYQEGSRVIYNESGNLRIFDLDKGKPVFKAPFPTDLFIQHFYYKDQLVFLTEETLLKGDADSYVHIFKIAGDGLKKLKTINLRTYLKADLLKTVENTTWPYEINDIFVKDNYLYIDYTVYEPGENDSLREYQSAGVVLSISDLLTPIKVGDCDSFTGFMGFIKKDFALTYFGNIIDLRVPTRPVVSAPIISWEELAGEGKYSTELATSISRRMRLLNETHGPILFLDVEMDGDYSFLSADRLGIVIFDFTDPTNPKLVKRIPTEYYVSDIEIQDARAYVAAGYDGVLLYDLRNLRKMAAMYNSVQENLFQLVSK